MTLNVLIETSTNPTLIQYTPLNCLQFQCIPLSWLDWSFFQNILSEHTLQLLHSMHTSELFGAWFSTHLWTVYIWSFAQYTPHNCLDPHSVKTWSSHLYGASFNMHFSIVWSLIQYTPLNCLELHLHTSQLFGASFTHLSAVWSLIYTPLNCLEPHSVYIFKLYGAICSAL